jgi:hypothetical protein
MAYQRISKADSVALMTFVRRPTAVRFCGSLSPSAVNSARYTNLCWALALTGNAKTPSTASAINRFMMLFLRA